MKNVILCLVFIFSITSFSIYSKQWVNPSKEWITVDSTIQNFMFVSMSYSDTLNCAALAIHPNDGTIVKVSKDGGLNWNTVLIDTMKKVLNSNGDSVYYYPVKSNCISQPAKDIIFLGCDSGLIKKTIDGGKSWKKIFLGKNGFVYAVNMYDKNFGAALMQGTVFITLDGGDSWTKSDFNLKKYSNKLIEIADLSIPDYSSIFLSASYDTSYSDVQPRSYRYFASYDKGISWEMLSDTTKCGSRIEFKDKLNGWAYGGDYWEYAKNSFCYMPRIYRTSDGGKLWEIQYSEIDPFSCDYLSDLKFYDLQNGIAVNSNTIFRTTNGGTKWEVEHFSNQVYYHHNVAWAGASHPMITSDMKIFRFEQLDKTSDKEPPHVYWTQKCNGNIEDGLAVDFPEDKKLRSNLKSITLDPVLSDNYALFVSNFTPGDTDKVRWKLRKSYSDRVGKAVVTFSDMNDNDTTITFETNPIGWDYPGSIKNTDFNLIGTAYIQNNVISLTPTTKDIAGAAWYKNKVPIGDGFLCYFNFRLSNGSNNMGYENSLPGGDGLAFVIQKAGDSVLGKSGGSIGYSGISNSIALEIDTYNDNLPSDSINDSNGNHIALFSGGINPNQPYHNTEYQRAISNNIPVLRCDSTTYHVMIEYNHGTLRVYIDTLGSFYNPSISINIDIPSLLDLGPTKEAWIGFTASTGNAWENHDIISWSYCPTNIYDEIKEQKDFADNIDISPNPAKDYIEINISVGVQLAVPKEVEIYDILGILYTPPNPLLIEGEQLRLDVSGLVTGVYFVKIGDKVAKFVKI